MVFSKEDYDEATWTRIMDRIENPPPSSIPSDPYAFTEFITFEFTAQSTLEDELTESGKMWARTLEVILSQEKTGMVCWGRTVERPDTVKLLIDWYSHDAYCEFKKSTAFRQLQSLWLPRVISPVQSAVYLLDRPQYVRENAVSNFLGHKQVVAVLTFKFPESFEKDEETTVSCTNGFPPVISLEKGAKPTFECWWETLSHYTFGDEAAFYKNSSCGGWSMVIDRIPKTGLSFCGILPCTDVAISTKYLQGEQQRPEALKHLFELADDRVTFEHVEFACFKNGWLGSVMKTDLDERDRRERISNWFVTPTFQAK